MPLETPLLSGATGTRLAPGEGPPFTEAPPGTSTTLTWLSFPLESSVLAPLWVPGADSEAS